MLIRSHMIDGVRFSRTSYLWAILLRVGSRARWNSRFRNWRFFPSLPQRRFAPMWRLVLCYHRFLFLSEPRGVISALLNLSRLGAKLLFRLALFCGSLSASVYMCLRLSEPAACWFPSPLPGRLSAASRIAPLGALAWSQLLEAAWAIISL